MEKAKRWDLGWLKASELKNRRDRLKQNRKVLKDKEMIKIFKKLRRNLKIT